MSRKRKRRGRNPGVGAEAPRGQEQNDGIEIIDDVNLLSDQKAESSGQAPPEAKSDGTANAGRSTEAADPTDDAAARSAHKSSAASDSDSSQGADQAASDDAPRPQVEGAEAVSPAAVSAVHVVEPLHESPHASSEGDRTVETLGELLQHAREAKGLSLEEVSARTRIALPTLRHLENDRFGELPAEAYVKGFLRSYGSFLNLDVSMLLRRYEKLSGHVSTPVAEIWDEVEVDRSRLHVWHPSRRTMAIVGAVLVVSALAWVFWSQGAVMLGLRPAGELQQIEMQLQREAQQGDTPQTSITGLDDAALQQDTDKSEGSGMDAKDASASGDATKVPSAPVAKPSTVEDTAPPVPQPPLKPAVTQPKPQATGVSDTNGRKPSVTPLGPEAPKPATTDADKKAATPAAKKPQPVESKPEQKQVKKPAQKPVKKATSKPEKKPTKKPAPTPSPEDAAGPPG